MRFWWMVCVLVIMGGGVYAGGCSHERDYGAYGCESDGNLCTLEDCSHLSSQPKLVANGAVVDHGPDDAKPAPECEMWVCQDGIPKLDPVTCSGLNAYCKDNKCVACNDGIKNGDEGGVDCGGDEVREV